MPFRRIPRRTFLRGLGVSVALPLLDGMATATSRGVASRDGQGPCRLVFCYVPNGAHMPDWTPDKEGRDYSLPPILEPLAPFQQDLLVMSGLAHDKSRANGDGGGDHARSVATFLTGCQAVKTAGKSIRVGISVDQLAARHRGGETPLPSLELGCERGRQAGACDTGYSCVYSSNMSWRTPSAAMPKEVNPRLVFDRLFGDGDPASLRQRGDKRQRYRKSVLDFVRDDAVRLKSQLGRTDRRKLDEYLASVRQVERQVAQWSDRERSGQTPHGSADGTPRLARPEGIPKDYGAHLRLMEDLIVLAFQGDTTRIVTFMFANAGSNRSYRVIGVPDGHHSLSHHGGNKEKQQKISKINRFHVTQFAHLLERLRATREGPRTLLDNSLVVYGSGIGDGNRHNHNELPIVLAGRGGGAIDTGRHVRYAKDTPLMNLYLAMLNVFGAPVERAGDSTGRLDGLLVSGHSYRS
jgi:hypothetical protein